MSIVAGTAIVRNNQADGNVEGDGIDIAATTVTAANNTASNNFGSGFSIAGDDSTTLNGNTANDNGSLGFERGLLARSASGPTRRITTRAAARASPPGPPR